MGKDVIGLIVGDAISIEGRKLKLQLNEVIQKNHLEKDIYMMGFRKDVPDILAAVDCLFIPSVEGLSLAALEAMSARCKIVSVKSSGAYELLSLARCGTFYEEGVSAIIAAEAVCKALEEQDKSKLERGHIFCKTFSKDFYNKNIRKIFSSVIGGGICRKQL